MGIMPNVGIMSIVGIMPNVGIMHIVGIMPNVGISWSRKEYIEELKKRHDEEKARLESLFLKEQAGRREDQVKKPTLRGNRH